MEREKVLAFPCELETTSKTIEIGGDLKWKATKIFQNGKHKATSILLMKDNLNLF